MSSTNSTSKQDMEQEMQAPQRRKNSWKLKNPQAILYDPNDRVLSTDKLATLDSKVASSHDISLTNITGAPDYFEVPLPQWNNRVDIYLDAKAKSGFVASVQLSKLGMSKNLQRRLRHNYTSLYVKGTKPLL